MLVRMIYASRATGGLTPPDVKDIIRSSRRNNGALGVTGALILSNGIFLQCLEGDHINVNALYHRIIRDQRHREPAVLGFREVDVRLYGEWQMGLIANTEANRPIFLKYSPTPEFDPYKIRAGALDNLFAEMVEKARVLTDQG